MRHNAARDHNEPEIVDALRKAGYFVTTLSDGGVPDLLVIRPHPNNPVYVARTAEEALKHAGVSRVTLIEVKQKDGQLTEPQRKFFSRCYAQTEL